MSLTVLEVGWSAEVAEMIRGEGEDVLREGIEIAETEVL
jgi:hypothetical protein